MTDVQREKITEMREGGMSCREISQATGISADTIKTYCRRHGIKPQQKTQSSVCLFCGKPLAQTPGKREKKFCDATCRTRWWSLHRTEHKAGKGMHHLTCAYCGKEFISYGNSGRKYCSHECYIKDRFGE
ncbi:MAG: RNA polymerase subunit sigma-70 [Lactobacillus sp.]|nr:MAG: RNA polymerase subunit sigma-70 [Lactobacillus sp.]